MARELETINHYRGLADGAGDDDAREFLLHIIEEEKLHVADVLRAIAQLDPDEASHLAVGYAAGHEPGQIPEVSVAAPGEETPPAADSSTGARVARAAGLTALTVGSLRGLRQ